MPRQKRWGELNPDAIKRRLVKLAKPVVEAASRPRSDGSRGGSGAPNGGVPVIDGGPPPGLPPVGGSVVITPVNPGFESDLTGWVIGSTPAVVSSTWAVITDGAQAHSGSKFLRWTGDSTPLAGGGPLETLTYFNTTHVTAMGTDYLIVNVLARCKRAAAGGVGLTRARIGIARYDVTGNQISNNASGTVSLFGGSLDSGWTPISTFVEKTAESAYFLAYVEAQGPAGTVIEFDTLTWNGAVP